MKVNVYWCLFYSLLFLGISTWKYGIHILPTVAPLWFIIVGGILFMSKSSKY